MMNGLRDRIVVQVDGQLKTGRDVVDRRADGRRGVRLRDRAAGRVRLHHDARLPSQHLPGRHRHAGSRAAEELHRQAGVRRELLPVHRRGSPRVHGAARLPDDGRDDRARRPARTASRPSITGRRAGSTSRRSSTSPRSAFGTLPRCVRQQDHGLEHGARQPADRASAPRRSSTGRRCRSSLPIRNVQPDGRHDARLRGDAPLRRRRACPTTPSGCTSPGRRARASARSCRRASR